MRGNRTSRAVIRDHVRRTEGEWQQWVSVTADDGIVDHMNNVYHVWVARAAGVISVSRHEGKIKDWELCRIVDELIGRGKRFYVDGRTKTDRSALLVLNDLADEGGTDDGE